MSLRRAKCAVAEINEGGEKMNFYVTYGCGSKLRDCYSIVEAPDYVAARKLIHAEIGTDFAFVYDENDFAGQVEQYGLKLVTLEAQGPIL